MNKIPFKFRLRTTLVIPFVLQIVAAVGLVGYLSFRNGEKAVNNVASQLRREVAARVQVHLTSYLAKPHLIEQIHINTICQKLLDPSNFQQMEGYFWQQSQSLNANIGTIAFANSKGEFVGTNKPEGYTVIAQEETGNVIRRYAVDNQGNRIKLIKEKPNYDARTRDWYKAAVQAGGPTWSAIDTSALGDRLDLSAVYPFYDSTGALQGVFMTDISLGQISEFLHSFTVGKSGKIFIMERSGLLVASSTIGKPFTVAASGKSERIHAERISDNLIQKTTQYLFQQLGNLNKIDTPQQMEFLIDGQKQFLQVTPFRDELDILDWLVIVVVPESDFTAEIDANNQTTVLLCIVTLIVAIIVGIFTAAWIAKPLLKLSQASTEIADGNLDQHVPSSSIIEIGQLANSFNSMAGQLQEAFKTLEDKVKERTADLATANESIIALNERLKGENLRMGAELDIARQIQMMILPKPEELENIEGLDIAGYMEPADEVGGDYYDVLHTDGVVTLGIGDVTGHGLESGILMLMAQTAVRTLQEIRETDPVVFLDTLNRTLYKNVQRMNSEKSLTLAIVNYADGKISISGQHEEAIIVRKGGQIERIDTMDLGFPIALDGDITEFISHAIFDLEIGDGVVLYTDGIPEAKNMDKKQYGLEQLCAVISQNWSLTAEGIKEAIVADVRQFIGKQKVFDDITLLVLKRQETHETTTP